MGMGNALCLSLFLCDNDSTEWSKRNSIETKQYEKRTREGDSLLSCVNCTPIDSVFSHFNTIAYAHIQNFELIASD